MPHMDRTTVADEVRPESTVKVRLQFELEEGKTKSLTVWLLFELFVTNNKTQQSVKLRKQLLNSDPFYASDHAPPRIVPALRTHLSISPLHAPSSYACFLAACYTRNNILYFRPRSCYTILHCRHSCGLLHNLILVDVTLLTGV